MFFREIKRIDEANSAAVFEFGGITGQGNQMFCFFHEMKRTDEMKPTKLLWLQLEKSKHLNLVQ